MNSDDTAEPGRAETRLTALEERLTHLSRAVEELSDVVASQADEIVILRRRVRLLMEREAERELSEGGQVPLADQKPPHW